MEKNAQRRSPITVIVILMLVIAIAGLIYYFAVPIPVADRLEKADYVVSSIVGKEDNSSKLTDITEFDSDAILSYLSGCSMTRMVSKDVITGSGLLLQITLNSPEEAVILICNSDECIISLHGEQYRLRDKDEVTDDLLSILYG